jgi:hypothetical protein
MSGDTLYLSIAGINFATLLCFWVLSGIELKRENWLNHYLVANPHLANDNEAFTQKFSTLTFRRQRKLLNVIFLYKRWAYLTIFVSSLNFLLSAYLIFMYYMDNKTPVSLITNTMLIGTKLYNVCVIAGSGDGVYLSAYRNQRLQFNDVNTKKINPLQSLSDDKETLS